MAAVLAEGTAKYIARAVAARAGLLGQAWYEPGPSVLDGTYPRPLIRRLD